MNKECPGRKLQGNDEHDKGPQRRDRKMYKKKIQK